MEESTKLILGGISSATILILGVVIKYVFSRKEEFSRKKEEYKIEAYSDFTQAIAGISTYDKSTDEYKKWRTLLVNSKTRISIYGSEKVICLIAEFWRIDPNLTNPDSMNRFVAIIQQMRKENHKSSTEIVDNKEISQLLFSTDI